MASGKADRLDGPAVPPAMTSRPPPATQPRIASSCSVVSCVESMSCQIRRSSAPHASTRVGQVGRIEADGQRRDVVRVGQQVEVADDVARPLGDDADDQLGPVVDRVNAALVVAIVVVAGHEADLELAPEARRLGVQAIGLVGLGRRSTEGPEARPPCAPPVSRSSPTIGGPSFLSWTSMAIHDPTRACPSSMTVASIVRPVGGVTAAIGVALAATGARRGPTRQRHHDAEARQAA